MADDTEENPTTIEGEPEFIAQLERGEALVMAFVLCMGVMFGAHLAAIVRTITATDIARYVDAILSFGLFVAACGYIVVHYHGATSRARKARLHVLLTSATRVGEAAAREKASAAAYEEALNADARHAEKLALRWPATRTAQAVRGRCRLLRGAPGIDYEVFFWCPAERDAFIIIETGTARVEWRLPDGTAEKHTIPLRIFALGPEGSNPQRMRVVRIPANESESSFTGSFSPSGVKIPPQASTMITIDISAWVTLSDPDVAQSAGARLNLSCMSWAEPERAVA